MNAMQIAGNSSPKTIGELQAYLAALEAAWTEEDSVYLGEFKNQPLYLGTPEGLTLAEATCNGCFGLVITELE
jgi:hypothetical protein